jgi:alpha-beta hydrolase superfamily lysophospholipase
MRAKIFRSAKIAGGLLGIALLTLLGVRIYDTQRGLPLEPWHTYVPHELHAQKLDASNWTQYLAAEATIFDDVQREVIVPEFNPFKYNSFPVNGARQAHRLTQALQGRIARYAREGKLEQLPPILTFQSLIDFTVSTRAIVSALYAHLPANGSELVLFDINRTARFGPLLRSSADTALARIVPTGPRRRAAISA